MIVKFLLWNNRSLNLKSKYLSLWNLSLCPFTHSIRHQVVKSKFNRLNSFKVWTRAGYENGPVCKIVSDFKKQRKKGRKMKGKKNYTNTRLWKKAHTIQFKNFGGWVGGWVGGNQSCFKRLLSTNQKEIEKKKKWEKEGKKCIILFRTNEWRLINTIHAIDRNMKLWEKMLWRELLRYLMLNYKFYWVLYA